MAPRQTSRKDTSRVIDYRIRNQTAQLSLLPRRMQIRHDLRSLGRARMLVRRVERERPTRRGGANMNSIAATLMIRERLRQRLLPHREGWRCHGEYAGGCACDGCGEPITSAQASYEVDFWPDVTSPSVKLHRACFEIWLYEGGSRPIGPSPNVSERRSRKE